MRKFLFIMLSATFLAVAAKPASAEILFSISADIPAVYSFSDSKLSDESASGLLTKIRLPLGIGFGMESYTVKGKYASTTSFEYDVTMIDIFYGLPVPAVSVNVGIGFGAAKFELVGSGLNFDDPFVRQFFVSVGLPLAVIFDVHVGYYITRAKASASGISDISLDSNMFTIGAKIGF